MSIKLFRRNAIWAIAMLVMTGICLTPLTSAAQESDSPTSEEEVSQAEKHYRAGVALYKNGNYREALDEFNRVLALAPDNDDALRYRNNCQSQLDIASGGIADRADTSFDTFDPGSLGTLDESPQLSPEEYKIQLVRSLVESGEQYLEHLLYDEARDKFEQVLLVAPDNKRAKQGLHDAVIGSFKQETSEIRGQIDEQINFIRTGIEERKLLPEGSDITGIKNYRVTVPKIEEIPESAVVKSRIEETLESPVGVVFEDIHLIEILDFITDTYEVNIMVDDRVILPPDDGPSIGPGGQPGAPPARPQVGGGGGGGFGGISSANIGGGIGQSGNQQGQGQDQVVTDGMISYINLKDVTLREALRAILRPLNLDFSIQTGFIWISSPRKIRTETFEDLETRYYELRNAGAETMFKVVINSGGGVQSTFSAGGGGGQGGGQGGGGGAGGGGAAGGGGGGAAGGGGGGAAGGGGGGGGQGGTTFQNISDLFSTFSDESVGEFPNPFGQGGAGGGGGVGGGGGGAGGGGIGGGTGAAGGGQQGQDDGVGPGLGPASGLQGEPRVMYVLRSLIPGVLEPVTGRELSFMYYNILTNQLVVHNTPTNHAILEHNLKDLDATPKQVAIEAKFLTVTINDQDKIGFQWNTQLSDANSRQRLGESGLPGSTGTIPFIEDIPIGGGDGGDGGDGGGTDQDGFIGTPLLNKTFTTNVLDAIVNPGPPGDFNITHTIFNTADGDQLQLTFDYLNTLGETELLSSPRVTTMNQKPAVIADLTRDYFQTGINTFINQNAGNQAGGGGGGGQGGDNAEIINIFRSPIITEFLFGITLSVTPQISGDQVRMWLNPQVVSQQGFRQFNFNTELGGTTFADNLSFPITSTQSVWTNVIVRDGDTLVLGGMIRDTTVKQESKMPYLADIPVIGFFFKGKSNEVTQSSLLIFVTPDIIDITGARYFNTDL